MKCSYCTVKANTKMHKKNGEYEIKMVNTRCNAIIKFQTLFVTFYQKCYIFGCQKLINTVKKYSTTKTILILMLSEYYFDYNIPYSRLISKKKFSNKYHNFKF